MKQYWLCTKSNVIGFTKNKVYKCIRNELIDDDNSKRMSPEVYNDSTLLDAKINFIKVDIKENPEYFL